MRFWKLTVEGNGRSEQKRWEIEEKQDDISISP